MADARRRKPLTLQYRAVDELVPYARNARLHSEDQIAKIAASIERFGFNNPVLIDGAGTIVAGHGRVMAAKRLGLAQVPVVVLGHLSDEERRAYTLADNRIALDATWDEALLAQELAALDDGGFDIDLTGFGDREFRRLLAAAQAGTDGETAADAAPVPPETPTAIRGDLWALGRHRLLCGDCTQPQDVARVMDGARAVLMNTDPPYGVDYAAVKNGIPRSGFRDIQARGGDIANDDLTDGAALQAFLEAMIRAAVPQLTETAAFYLWHPMLTQGTFFAAAAAADILIHRQIIWVKPHFVLTRSGMYHWKHELCFYGWRRAHVPPWHGDKGQSSVWEVAFDGGDRHHPTQKPVALFERPMLNHSIPGEAVFEPFCGSGSQLIAAERLDRVCRAIEIAPKYIDATILRWQAFTGDAARLDGDGRSFAEIARARGVPLAA